jgi:SH3 domain-containing YSC84-like protein 1
MAFKSGRGQPHSKTLTRPITRHSFREVLECRCPLPLSLLSPRTFLKLCIQVRVPLGRATQEGVGYTPTAFCLVLETSRLNNIATMKRAIFGVLLLSLAGSAMAVSPTDLDRRIYRLNAMFEEMQQKPDKRIPADLLRRAHGIILLDRTKAGFLFAFQGGVGVAMAKDPNTHQWSAPAFISANDASIGFQVGGEQGFFVILIMDSNATRLLTDPTFQVGGEASGTAGNFSGGAEGSVASREMPVLVFHDKKGLFGGASVKAGNITPDKEANWIYYGQYASMRNILFDRKIQPTESAARLIDKLNLYSNPPRR